MSDFTTKICLKCGKEYPATSEYFVRDKNRKDGLFTYCKVCVNTWKKQYRENNAEKISAGKKDWYERNREHSLKVSAQWQRRNPDKVKTRNDRWAKKNPDKKLAGKHRRRANKVKSGGSYTPQDIDKQLRSQKHHCYYCNHRLTKKYHIDHVIPLVKGGNNFPDNLVCACPKCNLSKGTKTLREWIDVITNIELAIRVAQRIVEREFMSHKV